MTEIQEQIAAARAALAQLDAADRERQAPDVLSEDLDDWSQPAPEPLQVGDWVHFRGSVNLSVGNTEADSFRSVYSRYGMDLQLTQELIDNNGNLWAMLDNPERQMERWRRETPLVARGPWPATEPRWEAGSHEADVARDAARDQAFQLTDDAARIAELRRIDREFGLRPTSRSLASYNGGLRS